jgi:hypothetical protein
VVDDAELDVVDVDAHVAADPPHRRVHRRLRAVVAIREELAGRQDDGSTRERALVEAFAS